MVQKTPLGWAWGHPDVRFVLRSPDALRLFPSWPEHVARKMCTDGLTYWDLTYWIDGHRRAFWQFVWPADTALRPAFDALCPWDRLPSG